MNSQPVPPSLLRVLELHSEALITTDANAIQYWSDLSQTMLVMAGLAMASLFALLALRRGDGNRPRFLEIPVAALLASSGVLLFRCHLTHLLPAGWPGASRHSGAVLVAAFSRSAAVPRTWSDVRTRPPA